MIECRRCGEQHPPERFRRKERTCKGCAAKMSREKRLADAYGLTVKQYERMLRKQGGKCAICDTDQPGGPHNVFCVDHCHKTGRVRGLLCTPCNLKLAAIGDDLAGLLRFYNYLLLGPISPDRQIGKVRVGRVLEVRYVDTAGRLVRKGTEGAVCVKRWSKNYYITANEKTYTLATPELEEALRRAESLTGKSRELFTIRAHENDHAQQAPQQALLEA